MTYLGIALLCLATMPGSFSNEDIHEYMSPEEVQRVFHTDHDFVPKYEVVKIHLSERLHKRDLPVGHKMHIRAFGKDINLWLHPRDSILAGEETPVYYAKYSRDKPQGVEFRHRDGLMGMVGRIFEDPDTLASLVIGTEESGRITVSGYIDSQNVVVRPLPRRVAEEYSRRRRLVNDTDDFVLSYHVVFDTTDNHKEQHRLPPVNETLLRQITSQHLSTTPHTLYPEVLVIVEYSMYRTYRRDIYSLLQYLLAFWNGVDLKYRSLESPRVRFHISGIILAEDPEATPYISNNSLGSDVFNSTTAMVNVGEFYYGVKDTFPLDSYDISVTMTRQKFGLDEQAGVLGMAWLGAACKHFDGYYSTASVTLIKDNGAFQGVFVTAHEMGHLLGASHDVFGGDCITQSGFVMAFTPWYTKNSSDFSICSTKAFDKQLEASKLDCLFNRPKAPGKTLPKLMPGRMKTLKDQCRALELGAPCKDETGDICVNFYCLDDSGKCTETGTGALDGTSCEGDNKFCLHMQCVSL